MHCRHSQRGIVTLRTVLLVFTGSLILALLAASFSVSFYRFRDYISSQLQGHAQDAATAVGLSLSNAIDGRDPVASASLIDAVFDSGRYLQITYTNYQGGVIAGRHASLDSLPVPLWFVSLAALPTPMGQAEVVRGWQRLGTVSVTSHPGRAYRDLWRVSGAMVFGTLLIGGLALALLFWLLTRTLAPLKAVEAQAEAIGRRDFRQRIAVSSTRELRQVTHAMNQMADDLEQLFLGQVKLIGHLRRISNEDSVTGLASRRAFDQRLKVEVESEEKSSAGVLVLIQLYGFADMNQRFGRDHADLLLGRIADAIKVFVLDHTNGFAGRRTGAEFAIFMPGVALTDAEHWARQLVADLDGIYADSASIQIVAVHGGVAQVEPGAAVSEVFAACDEALRRAQAEHVSGCYSADTAIAHHYGAEAWRELIARALTDEQVKLWQQPALARDGHSVLHQHVFARLLIGEDWIRGDVFLPVAERFGLTAKLDLLTVDRALTWLAREPELVLSMTLGNSSLTDESFQRELVARLTDAEKLRSRLWVGLSEHAVHHHRDEVRLMVKALRKLKVSVVVERFGVGGVPFSYLRNLPFQAMRIDHSFVHEIHRHKDNRFFLESIVAIAHSRGVKVFVAGVETAPEWELLQALDIDGAMGYHLGRPAPAPDFGVDY